MGRERGRRVSWVGRYARGLLNKNNIQNFMKTRTSKKISDASKFFKQNFYQKIISEKNNQ